MPSKLWFVALPMLLGLTACGEGGAPETSHPVSKSSSNQQDDDSLETPGADVTSAAETALDAVEKLRGAGHGDDTKNALPISYRLCRPLQVALENKRNQSSWHAALVLQGKPVREAKKIDGRYYELVNGSWTEQAINYLEMEHERAIYYLDLTKKLSPMASLQRVKILDCSTEAPTELDGEKLKVITYNREVPKSEEPFRSVKQVARMYVGVKDGLPHRIEYGVGSDRYHAYTYKDAGPREIGSPDQKE